GADALRHRATRVTADARIPGGRSGGHQRITQMSDRPFVDGPELVPPAELLELRGHLAVAPRVETRRAHLDAIVAQVRDHRRTAWGRAASSAARGAAAVVVTLTVTTGLAAADVLPDQAQKIFTSVSDRFGG